jgi:hypothetical protein
MVSFDDVALFPNIPINSALEFMNDWLLSLNLKDEKRSAFMEIAESCMALNLYDHYKQTSGTSMGNPISPIIANIYNLHESLRDGFSISKPTSSHLLALC